jgi:hypothetical protein
MLAFVGIAAEQAVAVSVLLGLGSLAAGLPGCLLWLKSRHKASTTPH